MNSEIQLVSFYPKKKKYQQNSLKKQNQNQLPTKKKTKKEKKQWLIPSILGALSYFRCIKCYSIKQTEEQTFTLSLQKYIL